MIKIKDIIGRQIIDSRGNPTVEVDIVLNNNMIGRAAVPSGASTGEHEAYELRDKKETFYSGQGVTKAVRNVNTHLKKLLVGQNPKTQAKLDKAMIKLDGTPNKSKLGANAILGCSLALARASALASKKPLWKYLASLSKNKLNHFPLPMCNILNGGAHSDAPVDIQEFMVAPVGANTFKQALQMCTKVFHALKKILKKNKLSTSVGDEGGFAPNVRSVEHALDLIIEAIKATGYKPKTDIKIALDIASSEFYDSDKQKYIFQKSTNKAYSSKEMVDFYINLCSKYPIYSIEDGLDENDWDGWQLLTKKLGSKIQLVGDDLYVTNEIRLLNGINQKAGNAILIKVNQIGTLTETLKTIQLAQDNKFGVVISHRSGETEDSFISDLAVGTHSGQIKTGSLSRSDRVAKYNQLLRISEDFTSSKIKKHKF